MKEPWGFIIVFSLMMLTIAYLSGCSTKGYRDDTTGSLLCLGYCELNVENRNQGVKTEYTDGTETTEYSYNDASGLAQDQADKIRARLEHPEGEITGERHE